MDGGVTPCSLQYAMNSGQVSVKGPLCEAVYQMKWPMPNEGNSSPAFQVVSPSTEPPHSFCQIFLPMAFFCAFDNCGNAPVFSAAELAAKGEQLTVTSMRAKLSIFIEIRECRILVRKMEAHAAEELLRV